VNDGFTYVEQIAPAAAGRSVLEHLAASRRHSTADEWRRRIDGGEVELDGATARAADAIRAGQRLAWHRPPWREPAAPLDFALLHRDHDVLAVAKPRGLPTMAAGGFHTHTLQWQVRRRFPEAVAVHRLGRGTSGVVLFACSPKARRGLPRAWAAGTVVRRYRGLVTGRPAAERFTVDTPIGLVPHAKLGRVHAASLAGKAARSHVRTVVPDDVASVVEIDIETGRPDQIRIHLAAAGHPLVGDPFFAAGGVPFPDGDAVPGDGGYRLHATRVEFPHPATGARTVIESPPPRELRDRS
jgi:23S rRNA pseudouridine1911/1915/1917 synthase